MSCFIFAWKQENVSMFHGNITWSFVCTYVVQPSKWSCLRFFTQSHWLFSAASGARKTILPLITCTDDGHNSQRATLTPNTLFCNVYRDWTEYIFALNSSTLYAIKRCHSNLTACCGNSNSIYGFISNNADMFWTQNEGWWDTSNGVTASNNSRNDRPSQHKPVRLTPCSVYAFLKAVITD